MSPAWPAPAAQVAIAETHPRNSASRHAICLTQGLNHPNLGHRMHGFTLIGMLMKRVTVQEIEMHLSMPCRE